MAVEGEEIDIEGDDSEDEIVGKLYQWADNSTKLHSKSKTHDINAGNQSP
jgi:hypothetical protein